MKATDRALLRRGRRDGALLLTPKEQARYYKLHGAAHNKERAAILRALGWKPEGADPREHYLATTRELLGFLRQERSRPR